MQQQVFETRGLSRQDRRSRTRVAPKGLPGVDDDKLTKAYRRYGLDGALKEFPEVAAEALQRRAQELGLRHDRQSADHLSEGDMRNAIKKACGNVSEAARSLECDPASFRRAASNAGLIKAESRPHWTTKEIAVIKRKYPTGGAQAVAEALKDRSTHAIYRMACRLGLTDKRDGQDADAE